MRELPYFTFDTVSNCSDISFCALAHEAAISHASRHLSGARVSSQSQYDESEGERFLATDEDMNSHFIFVRKH